MDFLEMLQDDIDTVFMNKDEFAEEIVYITAGTPQTQYVFNAVVERISESSISGQEMKDTIFVHIPSSAIASPAVGDSVIIGSSNYRVEGILRNELGVITLKARKGESRVFA